MASRVQHIVRWAVQDWRTSRVRSRSAMSSDPYLRVVYHEILMALYESGGELPNDPEVLCDILMVPAEEIVRCLPILKMIGGTGRGGITIEGDLIRNQRVTEDIEDARAFREQQAEHGRQGGAKGGKGRPKATPTDQQGYVRATPNDPKAGPNLPYPVPVPQPLPNPVPPPTHPGRVAGVAAREEQPPCQPEEETGAEPPNPRVVVRGKDSPSSRWKPPPPDDPADEAACEAFGEALMAAWPEGEVNLVRFQRALRDVWRQGLIRADGTEPRTEKSRTAGQVLADMPLWKAYHESGARPKHLETFLTERSFLTPVPRPLKSNNGSPSATRRRWGSDLAPGTTNEDVDRARARDLEIFGPREA